jgi:hypothetical protein
MRADNQRERNNLQQYKQKKSVKPGDEVYEVTHGKLLIADC